MAAKKNEVNAGLTKAEKLEAKRARKAERKLRREMRRHEFRQKRRIRRRSVSLYFVIWAAFAALSLVIVLFFALSQQLVFAYAYKNEAMETVVLKGKIIEDELKGEIEGDLSGYIRRLSTSNRVRVCLIDEQGEVVFPKDSETPPVVEKDEDNSRFPAELDAEQALKLVKKFNAQNGAFIVYEAAGECIYGSKVALQGVEYYLYVGQPLELLEMAMRGMNARVLLLATFVLVMAMAVSFAISGWITKPLSEMREKANRLAKGEFGMDFQGDGYGLEMAELANALNYAQEELSKMDKMQKDLIANVSHDFKTPLTMIKAYASMIMEISGEIPEKRNKHAQVIVDEADRLASLVNDVLDLSKLQSGIEVLQKMSVDMSEKVKDILARFEYLKETQGYEFIVEIEEDLYANVDDIKIEQALYNLIGNAVNYTGEDKRVFVRLKKENEECFRFSVTDTGSGIPTEEIGAIWERYYRSGETHKRPVKGTGLGLSIVKTIFERHALRFGVESQVGSGSTFYVLFPTEK